MNAISKIAVITLGALGASAIKKFFDKYDVLVFDKEDVKEMTKDQDSTVPPMDLRGNPTHQCLCGCEVFNVKTIFHNYEIGQYFLDMECANCGSLATAPTPIDRENLA